MSAVNDSLEKVLETSIVSCSFDILKNTMSLRLKEVGSDSGIEHTVEFLRVATAYYVNGSSRKHFTPYSQDSWLELSDGAELKKPVKISIVSEAGEDWVQYCSGGANVILDIWGETVLIEAAEVRVDGESFVIGDW